MNSAASRCCRSGRRRALTPVVEHASVRRSNGTPGVGGLLLRRHHRVDGRSQVEAKVLDSKNPARCAASCTESENVISFLSAL